MEIEVLKIGGIHPVDQEGYLLDSLNHIDIQDEYLLAITEIVQSTSSSDHFSIHSIYIRGSVAKGKAQHSISDLDIIFVVKNSNATLRFNILKILNRIRARYSYIPKIEMNLYDLEQINYDLNVRFVLKTQSLCVFGKDVRKNIQRFKLEDCPKTKSQNVLSDILKSEKMINAASCSEQIKKICSWISKRILRAGFELVMEKEGYYTRDLYYCYRGFRKHFPDFENKMYGYLYLALNPTMDKNALLKELSLGKNFMKTEIDR